MFKGFDLFAFLSFLHSMKDGFLIAHALALSLTDSYQKWWDVCNLSKIEILNHSQSRYRFTIVLFWDKPTQHDTRQNKNKIDIASSSDHLPNVKENFMLFRDIVFINFNWWLNCGAMLWIYRVVLAWIWVLLKETLIFNLWWKFNFTQANVWQFNEPWNLVHWLICFHFYKESSSLFFFSF